MMRKIALAVVLVLLFGTLTMGCGQEPDNPVISSISSSANSMNDPIKDNEEKETEPLHDVPAGLCKKYEEAMYEKFNSYAKDNGLKNTPVWIEGTMSRIDKINTEQGFGYVAIVSTEEGDWLVFFDTDLLLELASRNDLSVYEEMIGHTLVVCALYQGLSDVYEMPAIQATVIYDRHTGTKTNTILGQILEQSPEYSEEMTIRIGASSMQAENPKTATEEEITPEGNNAVERPDTIYYIDDNGVEHVLFNFTDVRINDFDSFPDTTEVSQNTYSDNTYLFGGSFGKWLIFREGNESCAVFHDIKQGDSIASAIETIGENYEYVTNLTESKKYLAYFFKDMKLSSIDEAWDFYIAFQDDSDTIAEISMGYPKYFEGEYHLIGDENYEKVDLSQKDTDLAADVSTGERKALSSAKSYLRTMAFSYSGLRDQLLFEGYTDDEATYAVENCGADWNEQAVKSAKNYVNFSAFSESGLQGQLEFEGFSVEQANYGVSNCGADWNEQAKKSAKSYLSFMSFSHEELVNQLIFDGFSSEQAEYGVSENGI